MPLTNHPVVPPNWSEHHRPTVEGTMTATGTIQIPASADAGTFDETLGYTVPGAPTTIYTGPMRVRRLPVGSTVQVVVVGDREVVLRQYKVTVPVDGPSEAVPIGAIVTVTSCDEEPQVVDRPLRVREVPVSTQAWARVLICEDHGPSTR